MGFEALYPPTPEPRWQNASFHATIRAQFRIETWIMLGAAAQSLLTLVLPLRLAFLPAVVYLLAKIANTFLVRAKVLPNPAEKNITMVKNSAQAPDRFGDFGDEPARDSMAVFFLCARSSSPLGLFDPAFKEVGDWLNKMMTQIKSDPDKYGLLGTTQWHSASEDSNPAILNLMYFKSAAHVHDYAHGPVHREMWNWWYKNLQNFKHVGIMHELYEVPSGNYESVYAQMAPTLAGLNQHKIFSTNANGEKTEMWQNPLVKATKGALKTSKGRMARSNGGDNDKYGHQEAYDNA